MINFRIIEIIDANTIKVEPGWSFTDTSGREFSDNKVKILGSNISPSDEYAKHRLSSLLINRDVELVNPKIIENNVNGAPVIACNVIVDKTDISYYFPEYSSKTKREVEYH